VANGRSCRAAQGGSTAHKFLGSSAGTGNNATIAGDGIPVVGNWCADPQAARKNLAPPSSNSSRTTLPSEKDNQRDPTKTAIESYEQSLVPLRQAGRGLRYALRRVLAHESDSPARQARQAGRGLCQAGDYRRSVEVASAAACGYNLMSELKLTSASRQWCNASK
jgi:hypothetical protein